MSPTSCRCSTPRYIEDTRDGCVTSARACAQRPRLPRSSPRSTLRRCHGARPGSGWSWVVPWRSRPRTHPNGSILFITCHSHIWTARYRDEQSVPNSMYRKNRPRPLVRLRSSRLPAVHVPPINPVISRGSYFLKGMRRLILGQASHLDAVSGYPCRTWLPSDAGCPTTGTPAVRPARSSRTRASPPQPSMRPRRIETELSHDVLNPARVPL
jgi:hypothetical protein